MLACRLADWPAAWLAAWLCLPPPSQRQILRGSKTWLARGRDCWVGFQQQQQQQQQSCPLAIIIIITIISILILIPRASSEPNSLSSSGAANLLSNALISRILAVAQKADSCWPLLERASETTRGPNRRSQCLMLRAQARARATCECHFGCCFSLSVCSCLSRGAGRGSGKLVCSPLRSALASPTSERSGSPEERASLPDCWPHLQAGWNLVRNRVLSSVLCALCSELWAGSCRL